MARNQTIRIRPHYLQADLTAHAVLQTIENYRASNPACTKTALQAKLEAMNAAREAEARLAGQLAAARDDAVAAEWDFHNALLKAKTTVAAQYGRDSNEIQALGLKKASERKTPVRKQKPAA